MTEPQAAGAALGELLFQEKRRAGGYATDGFAWLTDPSKGRHEQIARAFLDRLEPCKGPCAGSVPGYYTDVGGDCPACDGVGYVIRKDRT